MNCLETRQHFADFWRKSLGPDERRAFLDHLAGCPACSHAFRCFALTAPVLYGNLTRGAAAGAVAAAPGSVRAVRAEAGGGARIRSVEGFVIIAALAAALIVYLAMPPRVTFEDVIVEDDSGAARTTYNPTDNLFWPSGAAPRSDPSDPGQPAPAGERHKHLAG
jgi:hypothetical protein